MNNQTAILVILSRMLDYPDTRLMEERASIEAFAKDFISSEILKEEVIKRITLFYEMELYELQELYVDTFDHSQKTNLYLTAQELGDSKRRGMALIQLQKLITEAGYDYQGREIVDYIPMLLELLAVSQMTEKLIQLSKRIAMAMQKILDSLPNLNPYSQLIEFLLMDVLILPSEEERTLFEVEQEGPDLDELPYPLMYR
ncbi:nitrate reductase molybdenum cofactor assembly chaperone [Cytobacillus sp. Hz8]|uniref:nitrate reductase molybdenum cofactor assembly chaperone n=1 Tax=Cytobacillus sp. Hz8 TaxID=3347168 RepID=UPI0035D8DC00